jgi:hypothetical protein
MNAQKEESVLLKVSVYARVGGLERTVQSNPVKIIVPTMVPAKLKHIPVNATKGTWQKTAL